MAKTERQIVPDLSELIDRLTINQLKLVLRQDSPESYLSEIKDLMYDIESIVSKLKVKINAQFIKSLINLAQINLHIWNTKNQMQKDPTQFESCMKLAHQLNGIRNQAKNYIHDQVGGGISDKKTNTLTDNLTVWDMLS